MNAKRAMALAVLMAALAGCVTPPQRPVEIKPQLIDSHGGRIGVIMTPLPKVDTHFPGAGCLLCLAAASVANSSLTTYSHSLPIEGLPQLKQATADLIRKKDPNVVVIDQDLVLSSLPNAKSKGMDVAKKDFSSLKQKYSIDKLVVLDIEALGFVRPYASYIPTSDPKGEVVGIGFMVDLSSNTYDWYQPVDVTISTDGKWDEPPKFPGLTDAYFQALETGKNTFLKPFGG